MHHVYCKKPCFFVLPSYFAKSYQTILINFGVRLKRWPSGQWLPQTASGHRVSKSGGPNGHREFQVNMIFDTLKCLSAVKLNQEQAFH